MRIWAHSWGVHEIRLEDRYAVLGYTSQARFLINCGLLDAMQRADARQRAAAHPLVAEHEMGELFKVIGFAKDCRFDALGFAEGDRSHRL